MALVQMRTPGGSYSMVDEAIVSIYEKQGWVLTSELPEFKTKDVTYYDEAKQTVTSSKGEEKPVEEVIETSMGFKENRKVVGKTLSERLSSRAVQDYTDEQFETLKNSPIEEKLELIKLNASNNILLTSSQKFALEKTYNLEISEINAAQNLGKAGQLETIESGPLNSGINTWWQLLGYDSIDEVNKEIASGALTAPEIRRAKDNAEEKRTGGSVTPKMFGPSKMEDVITTVTVSKGGKIVEILESDLHLYEKSGWSTDIDKDTSDDTLDKDTSVDNNEDTEGEDLIINEGTEKIGETQVVVYGPNGARTTANTFKRPGEEMSEYDRLIAGLIPGREGYKNATKSEKLTADYAGDYGGEDASTPMDQRESVVGIGNTDYDNKDYSSVGQVVGSSGNGELDNDKTFTPNNPEAIELNNIPVGAEVWDVDGTLYLAYAVPGAGDLYTGSTIWMAYDVVGNDLFEAGLLTAGFEYKGPNGSPSKSWFDSTAVLAGNTNQLIGMDSDPFASFVETYKEEALLRPWLLDNQFIELQAEAALEDRDISEAEWRATTWYQTHSQAERDWMDIELSDPSEAQRQRDDLELYYKNQLQGLGVNNVPDGLIQWVTNKNITGNWSDLKTAEQLQLFADPYKTGERDIQMSNFIATSGFGDVDRTAAREKEVVELYRKWLGPSLGSLTQEEVSSIAGRLRDDPDYEDALVNSLKQSRLAAFSNYTNPELTYEDIARPWRNLTTSVWGQNADETQGWWQEMLKSNDYSTAQTTLREKGLEQNINQVSVDASKALQNALGQGSISQTGVNV